MGLGNKLLRLSARAGLSTSVPSPRARDGESDRQRTEGNHVGFRNLPLLPPSNAITFRPLLISFAIAGARTRNGGGQPSWRARPNGVQPL